MTRKPSIFHRLAQILDDDDFTMRTFAALFLAVAAALGGAAGCVLVGSVLVSVSPWLLAIVAPSGDGCLHDSSHATRVP